MNIKELFPDEWMPFFGGFGNRDTDAISYRAVSINLDRIFIINPDGEVHHFNSATKKSYPGLIELVHEYFPVERTFKYPPIAKLPIYRRMEETAEAPLSAVDVVEELNKVSPPKPSHMEQLQQKPVLEDEEPKDPEETQ
jgi:phosphatidate phosphatase LPIN